MAKPRIATTSLAGCFGCHMSMLDIDERILELVELVDFDKSPINDKKHFDCMVKLDPATLMQQVAALEQSSFEKNRFE